MSTGDPLADVIVQFVEDLVAEGVHALDPAERAKTVRQKVAEEAASWPSVNPGLESARLDALAAKHHVDKASE